jgi:hypothetical protein
MVGAARLLGRGLTASHKGMRAPDGQLRPASGVWLIDAEKSGHLFLGSGRQGGDPGDVAVVFGRQCLQPAKAASELQLGIGSRAGGDDRMVDRQKSL